jgi:hypothetical protein
MSAIEGIRASRPLERDPWLQNFEAIAPEIVGEDALNFNDTIMGNRELEIIGPGKFITLRDGPQNIQTSEGDKLAERAEEDAPRSFDLSLFLITTGELGITYMSDPNEDRKRIMVADIHQARIMVAEQRALEGIVDEALGAYSTRKPFLRVKLAVVNEGYSISEKELSQLAYFLPEKMLAQPGKITPMAIGPGSIEDTSAVLDEFAKGTSLDAAQSVAEASTLR